MGARRVRSDPGDMRCLVVDDNVSFLMAMRYLLERDGAEVVSVASTGAEAVECAGRLRPDVILLDVRLGSESGFDVAHRLEEDATAEWRPAIILVSTHAEDELAGRMAANPSLGFIEKTAVSVAKIREISSTLPR
jgi:CheY-like chemotaxis protein